MNYTTTTNGAVTNKTSGKECLDLFTRIGNMRWEDRLRILEEFDKAYQDDKELATQILFWARAAREGSGERKTFHTVLREIGETSPAFISDNARTLAELGYWKDLVPYFHIQGVVKTFAQAIREKDRLACKWAPRKCAVLRDELGFTNREYRKWLKRYSETVEQQMSNSEWSDIQYSSVPGSAMRRYGKAFDKQDSQRFVDWKNDKTSKASVSATYPHEVLQTEDEALADKLWDNLPNFLEESNENILPMIDTSGSMYGEPLAIAISLGMYLSERSKGEFHDMFLTFSEETELVKIQGDNVKERLNNISRAGWGMNTDFTKAYEHILRVAKKHNVMKDSMPTMILVLSDMQFDESQNSYNSKFQTHFSHMEEEYEKAGYDFPKIVFWNLDAHFGTPARCDNDSVAMVSGYSPSIMKAVLNAEEFNPISVMMEALKDIELDYTNLPKEFRYELEI
jgi:Mg-chelatase subunit ChlD